MKNKIMVILLSALSLGIAGCKKYLTTLPDNRIDANTITTEQIKGLLTDAYPHRTYFSFAEAMSDNAEDKGNPISQSGDADGYDINVQAYRYTDNIQEFNDDAPLGYWYECYRAVATANQALALIQDKNNDALYAPQIGEALMCRAYAHFMLVTFFAKAYNPTTAASDPGVPYITTVQTDPFANYSRGTVQQDYDSIQQDITKALPLLNDASYGNAPKFHFNQQAAYAFATRFYLFKQDYVNTIAMANQVFGTATPASVLRNIRNYPTVYLNIQVIYTATSETSNFLLQEGFSNYGALFPYYRFGMGANVESSIFNVANFTGGALAWGSRLYGASPSFYNFPKFYSVSRTPTTDHSAFYVTTFPLLNAEEVLMNRAEAYAKSGNYTAALADLQSWANDNTTANVTLTQANIVNFWQPAAAATKDTAAALVQSALFGKRVSYMFEGMRWLDVVRLNIPVTHASTQGTTVLAPDDDRRLLQLPQEAVSAGMPLNPR